MNLLNLNYPVGINVYDRCWTHHCDGRHDIALVHHGMPVQEEARLEGLDKISERRKAYVGLVILIVDAARWRVGD